jgi:hypothetical protein
MRLEIGLVENLLDCRATHPPGMSTLINQGGSKVIRRPAGRGTTLLLTYAACQIDKIKPLRG